MNSNVEWNEISLWHFLIKNILLCTYVEGSRNCKIDIIKGITKFYLISIAETK